MNYIYALLALSLCAATLDGKKYLCSIRCPVSPYITEMDTREECLKYCDACEEIAQSTEIVTEFD